MGYDGKQTVSLLRDWSGPSSHVRANNTRSDCTACVLFDSLDSACVPSVYVCELGVGVWSLPYS